MNALSRMTNQSGFTLLEVLIALVIFAVGILGVATMQISSIQGNSKGRQISEATNVAARQVEAIVAWDYNSAPLIDDDDAKDETDADADIDSGDGTNQDLDNDGIDDGGNDFGLADTTNPDGFRNDGFYDIYWNVAVDHPLPDTKTIRVIVDSPLEINDIPITFVKYRFAN